MPAPEHPTDPSGFRVPERFDDRGQAAPRDPSRYQRQMRVFVCVVLSVVVGAMLFRSHLADVGREAMADYYLARARPHVINEDYRSAVAEIDHAIAWHDKAFQLYMARAEMHAELRELDAAASDYGTALDRLPKENTSLRSILLMQRSVIYQRQRKKDEALADLAAAHEIRSAKNSNLFNHRAYARAVFNVELDEALKDVEQAIAWSGKSPNAAFIDTRGYVYFRLGRYDEALKDIEQAIVVTESDRVDMVSRLDAAKVTGKPRERELKLFDHNLAVMYHHRGEIHEKLGNQEEAKADLKKALEMGYNHEAGVF
jgi:tetratricopeptide (TPR) repeat protein